MPTNKETFKSKMDALANSINAKAGTSGAKDLDELKTAVDAIPTGGGGLDIYNLFGGVEPNKHNYMNDIVGIFTITGGVE